MKKDILFGIILFIIPFFLPSFGVSTDVGTLVTATSSVFAIVAGFFIADAMANYLRLQTLISTENASLISIANNAKKIDEKNFTVVHEAIDNYVIAQLDEGTLSHIFSTQTQIDNLDSAINKLQIQDEDAVSLDHLLSVKEKVAECRQEIALAAKRNLTVGHWLTLITLGVLVILTVLAIRDGTLFMNIVAGSMMVGTLAVLVLLREMDNNHLLEKKLAYENPREVFHAIGKQPYYPHFAPLKARVPDESGSYRLGKKGGEL